MDPLQLQWENYKMRQSHVWRSFERLILIVVTLWAIPFVKPNLLAYKYIIYFFPLVALFLSIAGKKLLQAEYNRLIAVSDKIKDINSDLDFLILKSGKKSKVKPNQIGRIMLNGICLWLIILSGINFLVILAITLGIIKLSVA